MGILRVIVDKLFRKTTVSNSDNVRDCSNYDISSDVAVCKSSDGVVCNTTDVEADMSNSIDSNTSTDSYPGCLDSINKNTARPVICTTSGQRFTSITRCAAYFKVSRTTIKRMIDDPTYVCKKLVGKSFSYSE